MQLLIKNQTDRETVATILFRNGYAVRQGVAMMNGKKTSVLVVSAGTREDKDNGEI